MIQLTEDLMKLLEDILDNMAGASAAIVRQAQEFKRLETAIEQVLDIRVKVSSIRNDTLYLQVPNAAQATQLQYRQYPFLSKLQHEGLIPNVRALKVQVRPDPAPASRVARQPAKISSDNQSLLQAHAEATDFPALKSALLKLSQR